MLDISVGKDEAGFLVPHRFGQASDIADDTGDAAGHGLDDGVGHGLAARGLDADVDIRIQTIAVGDVAQKRDAIGDSERYGVGLQRRHQRAVAEEDESRMSILFGDLAESGEDDVASLFL